MKVVDFFSCSNRCGIAAEIGSRLPDPISHLGLQQMAPQAWPNVSTLYSEIETLTLRVQNGIRVIKRTVKVIAHHLECRCRTKKS